MRIKIVVVFFFHYLTIFIYSAKAAVQEQEQQEVDQVVEILAEGDFNKTRHFGIVAKERGDLRCARRWAKSRVSTPIYGEVCCDRELDFVLSRVRESTNHTLGDTARRLQRKFQKLFDKAFEIIISDNDFSIKSYYNGQRMCKIRTDSGLYVAAWRTPVKYDIHNRTAEWFFNTLDSEEELGTTHTIKGLREPWRDIRLDPLADLGSGTHCNRTRRDGNKCCSREIYLVINITIDEMTTSPIFKTSNLTPGVAANVVQKRVQQRFARIFEVVASRENFAIASYSIGDFFCKVQMQDVYILAYETAHQSGYHPYDKIEVKHFGGLTDPDPLGTPLFMLPGQVDSRKGIELEDEGYRLGFPKDSHCDHSNRTGMKCCHMDLFQSMHGTVLHLKDEDTFDGIDRRQIAAMMRKRAEEAINEPLELIISETPFHVSSNHEGDCTCKFKADQYHIMAWRTPGNYNIGVDMYADNGHTAFLGCGANNTALNKDEGATCCNRTLRYSISKTLHEHSNLDFTQMDTETVTKALSKMGMMQFGRSVESVIARGDFHWKSPGSRTGGKTCKVDLFQFHALIFETADPLDPDWTDHETMELLDVIRPPDFKSGGGGGGGKGGGGGNGGDGQGNGQGNGNNNANGNGDGNGNGQGDGNGNGNGNANANANVNANADANAQVANALTQSGNLGQRIPSQAAIEQIQNVINNPNFANNLANPANPANPAMPPVDPWQAFLAAVGAGGACFAENSWVITPDGRKTMAELQIGDFVLTAQENKPYFEQVALWLHREKDFESIFVELKTEGGRELLISPKHLIYREKLKRNSTGKITLLPENCEIFAQELEKGDYFYVLHEGSWRLEEIIEISVIKKRGIYAPLTPNGRIIVNDILASCYSELDDVNIQNTYFATISELHRYLPWISNFSNTEVLVPYFLSLYQDLIKLVIPLRAKVF